MSGPLRLLLVEDNPGDVFLIRESLRQCSVAADVTVAADGEQALNLLGEGVTQDLIILDLNIPRIDGYALLKRLAARKMAIVVFTSGTEGAEKALMLGAREVVGKPTHLPDFVEAVRRMIGLSNPRSEANRVCIC